MKRIAALFVALALAGLCGCGEGGTKKTSTPEITSTTTVPTIHTPAAASAVFLSEVYTAPDSYEGVPAAYKPILDAVYLHEQIQRVYNEINLGRNPEHENTHETMKEHETVIENLYKPYLIGRDYYSDKLTRRDEYEFGYTLKDINNDGVPELLLLQKDFGEYPNPKRTAAYALFTIANGKAVRVPGDFYYMAEDGITYNIHNSLSSYKLEPGATELTQLCEYRMRLLFWEDKDKPPQPYWYKVDMELLDETELEAEEKILLITEEET